jgi:hypothetical protein
VTRYTRHSVEVPESIALPCDPEDQSREDTVTVVFDYHPGCEPSGLSGPPENYDPGEGPEFVIETSGTMAGADLPDHVEEELVNWLLENWEAPADEPDPDWLRDQQLDDAL